MKKLVALFALALVVAFATGSYAEVQNVKVGGDIRIRGNYSGNKPIWDIDVLGSTILISQDQIDPYGFIQQRTRAIVEADLTDNVAVNVTVEAQGIWGEDDSVDTTSISGVDIRREWDAGFSEAWVQLSELYYSPLTVKLGRQYLHYGTGFVISSAEYEWNFDAAKAVLSFEPWTIDLVFGKLYDDQEAEVTSYTLLDAVTGLVLDTASLITDINDIDLYLYGGNLRYSADTWNVEGYVFGIAEDGLGVDIKPIIVGARGDITPVENLDVWGELAYETGEIGDLDLSAFGADVGGTYTFPDVTWKPTIGLAWSWGQGDDEDAPFFSFYEYDYYGYLYSPNLSNIHIINANLTVEPIEKLALILDYYHYIQDEELVMDMADLYQDDGGFSALTNGTDTGLGNEVDVIAEYDYTEDVSTQLYLAWFWPGDAYDDMGAEDDAYEVRGEIIVSF